VSLAYISYVLVYWLQCGVNFYQNENFESWVLISCEEMIFLLLLSIKLSMKLALYLHLYNIQLKIFCTKVESTGKPPHSF